MDLRCQHRSPSMIVLSTITVFVEEEPLIRIHAVSEKHHIHLFMAVLECNLQTQMEHVSYLNLQLFFNSNLVETPQPLAVGLSMCTVDFLLTSDSSLKNSWAAYTALETRIAWKSSLLTKIILRRTLLVEKTLR